MHARTLAATGETKLMHIQCHKCQNAFLTFVLVSQVGASSVGVLTDLGYEDVVRFRSNQNVSVNDVINIHKQLEQGLFQLSFERKGKKITKIPEKHPRKKLGK
jgi:hypothetical protein